jgi:quercetin dioxygenase-like cupin family protein
MRIERWDPRRDGPFSERALQQKLEARGFVVTLRTFPAGAVIAGQPQDRERLAAVISGLVKLTLDDDSAILRDGDIAAIPAGASGRFEALGAMPAQCGEAVRPADSD